MIGEFHNSTPDLGDPAKVKANFEQDGYLFFKGLLDPDKVLRVRSDITHALASLGWTAEGTEPMDAVPGDVVTREGDPNWWPGYIAIQSLYSFHELAHDPAILSALSAVINGEILVHPRSIARVTYPTSEHPTPPHQDFPLIQGSPDTFTLWVPFGRAPIEYGSLRILRGSYVDGFRKVVPKAGVGGVGVEVDYDDPNWCGCDYEIGDVLAFHAYTVHYAPPNRGDRLRLSADYRYQPAGDPIVQGSLMPHGYGSMPGWDVLAKDWESDWPVKPKGPLNVVDIQDPFSAVAPESRYVHA